MRIPRYIYIIGPVAILLAAGVLVWSQSCSGKSKRNTSIHGSFHGKSHNQMDAKTSKVRHDSVHLTVSAQELPEKPHVKMEQVKRLTEEDYREVAKRLGVETAAIKAVVDIEAGPTHQGFFKPGQPIINFDLTMFRRFASRNGVNLSKYAGSHAVVFNRPNVSRYGSTQGGQQARLAAARTIDERTAIEGCFWGMFQLGGFNWKLCGANDIVDFVDRMSRSERDQLDLFANFIVNSGLQKSLQQKNWSAFARGYNGPGYAARGYHTKLANRYAKHKRAGY